MSNEFHHMTNCLEDSEFRFLGKIVLDHTIIYLPSDWTPDYHDHFS